MIAIKQLLLLGGVATLVLAQAEFGGPENSAAILAALQDTDDATIASAQAAAAYQPNDADLTRNLTFENYVLRSDWQYITFLAQSSQGFFSDTGAQDIIDFINNKLYPDQKNADQIYTDKRDVFVQGGFIDFINPGLIQLRLSVAEAAAAIIAKTRADRLTAMTIALLSLAQNYADTQEYQQFGAFPTPSCTIPSGLCGSSGTNTGTPTGPSSGSATTSARGYGGNYGNSYSGWKPPRE